MKKHRALDQYLLKSMLFSAMIGLVGVAVLGSDCADAANGSSTCSSNKRQELLEQATADNPTVTLDCSVTLPKNSTVTKQIVIEGDSGSGVKLNCNGGSISPNLTWARNKSSDLKDSIIIRSNQTTGTRRSSWRAPDNVTVSNCTVNGSIRIYGLGENGQSENVKESGYSRDHTYNAQAAAPRKINLDHLRIKANGRIPLYVSPGVTFLTLSNSTITGKSDSTAIYLDAESANNTIKNNLFELSTKSREMIAIDGSANNEIVNNEFNNISHGGIYVYRNCGEGGAIRHQKPQHNLIEGNTFSFHSSKAKPAVWLGQRMGKQKYCSADRGYVFGSSISNADFADNNTVVNNKMEGNVPVLAIKNLGTKNVVENNDILRAQINKQVNKQVNKLFDWIDKKTRD